MPSASMYASPYTWKEPPPKIDYPPVFDFNKITFKYMFDSKVLALATLLLLISCGVNILMVILPFWFELVLSPSDGTYGNEGIRERMTINTGIFYMREDHFDNLAFLSKYSNRDVVPKTLGFAQVCSVIGNVTLSGCLCGALILMFRRFGSATGSMMLAAGTTVGAIFTALAVVFSGILLALSNCDPSDDSCTYADNQVWRMIPIYEQRYRVEPHLTPFVKPNFAFYIAILGAALSIVSAVMMWIEAMMTTKNMTNIRYQQLKEVRDPYENDIKPGKKFAYAAPDRFGVGVYGMQPVIAAPGVYQYQQPSQGFVPQPHPGYAPARPSVGFSGGSSTSSFEQGTSKRPPSDSGSSRVGTREINL